MDSGTGRGEGINWVDKECKSVEWYSPPEILDPVRNYYGGTIPLDPATTITNITKANVFYTKEDDGLTKPWADCYINPPYGKVFPIWCKKIHDEAVRGVTIIALLPCGARFSTRYFQANIIAPPLSAVCFHKGRVKFVNEMGERGQQNPYDSAIYLFNGDWSKFKEHFSHLGACLHITF